MILFRVQTWLYPETNNALLAGRIRFVAVGDGTDHVLNEDGDRIVLEDDTGNITGDFFQSYSFFQTVAAQEMADGKLVVEVGNGNVGAKGLAGGNENNGNAGNHGVAGNNGAGGTDITQII